MKGLNISVVSRRDTAYQTPVFNKPAPHVLAFIKIVAFKWCSYCGVNLKVTEEWTFLMSSICCEVGLSLRTALK